MHFIKFTQLVAIALCTLHTSAGPLSAPTDANNTLVARQIGPNIDIGRLVSDDTTVAWGAGDDRCNGAVVKRGGGNFCGFSFQLNGMDGTFDFEGCGGPLWVNRNGAFYANCGPYSESPGCLLQVQTQYACVP